MNHTHFFLLTFNFFLIKCHLNALNISYHALAVRKEVIYILKCIYKGKK
jgi:hypothetical protein